MAGFSASRVTVRKRLVFIFVLTLLFSFYLIGRLAWIQIVRADELYDQAWKQWNHNMTIRTNRGSLYDRHGRLLAGSSAVDTVAAIPQQLDDPQEVAAVLSPILEMNEQRIYELITMERSAVFIKRKVDPETAEKIREMNISGIVFFKEEKRYYPAGNLASQLLGFVGMDQGWTGLELYYEDLISGSESSYLYQADGRGRQLPNNFQNHPSASSGYHLYLTIDETIQHIIEKELEWVMAEAAPKQAIAIVVDPQDGAILAAASRPDYDLDQYASYAPENWLLAPITSSFEPGSTFKTIVLAALIEEGLYEPEETYHCTGHITVGDHQINCWTHDRGGHGTISYHDSLALSCNPAFVTMANRLGKDKLVAYTRAFGFGKMTGVDYPGESSGMIFRSEQIGPVELATYAFGQGISVTPIQQVMAIAAIANNGNLYEPYLVQNVYSQAGELVYSHNPKKIRQVVSVETTDILAELMENVILEGTGHAAEMEGYRVAGKTGTAEKLGADSAYMTDYFIHSLVGFAPLEEPRLALFVSVDGITRGPRYGTFTSAPMFKRIMEDTLNYLNVAPSVSDWTDEDDNLTSEDVLE